MQRVINAESNHNRYLDKHFFISVVFFGLRFRFSFRLLSSPFDAWLNNFAS